MKTDIHTHQSYSFVKVCYVESFMRLNSHNFDFAVERSRVFCARKIPIFVCLPVLSFLLYDCGALYTTTTFRDDNFMAVSHARIEDMAAIRLLNILWSTVSRWKALWALEHFVKIKYICFSSILWLSVSVWLFQCPVDGVSWCA